MITPFLGRVAAGQSLTLAEMSEVIDQILAGAVPEGEVAVLLTALHTKGETADEIAGAAKALRRHMTPVHSRHTNLLDTCGTGGIGSELFNISTAAAIVVAAGGVPVAKHGNKSVTSKSGSADVLTALGVNVEASISVVERCLNELGICFCFAPRLHPAMKHVASVRQKLGICHDLQSPRAALQSGRRLAAADWRRKTRIAADDSRCGSAVGIGAGGHCAWDGWYRRSVARRPNGSNRSQPRRSAIICLAP
jgi:hypothetical protein